jgi:fructokinase
LPITPPADPFTDAVIVVIGEALVDVVTTAEGSHAFPGGSPANVAVGVARLGISVDLVTRIGADANGDLLYLHLTGNGVRLLQPRDAQSTSVAEATIGSDGAAAYDFQIGWSVSVTPPVTEAIARASCVHTGSIAATLAPGVAVVADLVGRARPRSTISYDPNCRPALMGDREDARRRVEANVGLSDVVKASDEDLDWLYPGRAQEDVAAQWLSLQPSLVIITKGAAGAVGMARAGTATVAVPPIEVRDTVGAGDSFMAAVLAGLADRDLLGAERRNQLDAIDIASLTGLLEFAGRAAAITCERPGADPPTRAELDAARVQRDPAGPANGINASS